MYFDPRSTLTTFLIIFCILIVTANSSENEKNRKKVKKSLNNTISEEKAPDTLDISKDENKQEKDKDEEEKDESGKDDKEKPSEDDEPTKETENDSKEGKGEDDEKDEDNEDEEKGKGKEDGKEENVNTEESSDVEDKTESPASESPKSKEESEKSAEETAPENTFAVRNSEGRICLLARLNATFDIFYPSVDGEKDIKVSLTHGKSKGKCESSSKTPLLQVSWNQFVFTMMFNKSDEENWVVSSIELTYDTSGENSVFQGATNPGKKTARSKNGSLFETPIGKSYFCPAHEVVLLYSANKQVVTARLKDVHLQPYGIEDGKFSQFHRCNKVVIDGLDETPFVQDETVPLAVGCTLALITLSILIGFSVHRAYNAAKVDYNNME